MKPRVSLTRRGLVRGLGGAVLGFISVPYPALGRVVSAATATPSTHTVAAGADDPGFWSGRVTAKTTDTLTLSSAAGVRVLRIPAGAVLWKEVPVAIDAVNVGDWVMARGDPQPDGSLAAKPGWAWVNIGQWHGEIIDVGPGGLVVRRADGRVRSVTYSQQVEVIRAHKQVRLAGGTANLTAGLQVGSVGLTLPDQSLRATRIWIY